MKIFTPIAKMLVLLITLSTLSHSSLLAQTPEEGEKLFTANCTACHAINDKVVGPALKDVHTKYKEDWLIKWIKNSQSLIKSGDADAVKISKEYNGMVMNSFENLTDVQVKSILAYIGKASSEAPKAAATADASAGSTTVAAPVSSTTKSIINWLVVIITGLIVLVLGLTFAIIERVDDLKGKSTINWSKINSILIFLFGSVGIAVAAWEIYAHGKLTVYNQEPASAHGPQFDNMFNITTILTVIVFFITQALLFWFSFRYKKSEKSKALFYPDNHKLELIWIIIPSIVLTTLVIYGLKTWNNVMNVTTPNARIVEVFGYQFGWNARYSGEDNKLGKHDFRQVGVINSLGVDTNDQAAIDDVVTNELHLPVNEPVMLKFRAKDVIHSAYLPHFRVQMNVVPGLPTQFGFTPTLTTEEMRKKLNDPSFDYILLCNKICGSAHYRMKMKVVVHAKDDFNKWYAEQPKLVQKNNTNLVSNEPAALPTDSTNITTKN